MNFTFNLNKNFFRATYNSLLPYRITFLLSFVCSFPMMGSAHTSSDENLLRIVREKIRQKVELSSPDFKKIETGSQVLFAPKSLGEFYQNRGFRLAWVEGKRLNGSIVEYLEYLQSIHRHGLEPGDYHLESILKVPLGRDILGQYSVEDLVNLELILTDSYLLLASHLYYGKLNFESADPQWKAKRKEGDFNFAHYLQESLEKGDLPQSLEELAPRMDFYQGLMKALEQFRELQNEYGQMALTVPDKKLEPGQEEPVISQVKNFLTLYGDLKADKNDSSNVYDEAAVEAMKNFQMRHGLNADGVLGKGSFEALSRSFEHRIDRILINMERLRWLPAELGEPHIYVNIADFSMQVRELGEVLFESRAVVGKPFRKTPVFSSQMTYMVLNPTWTVPPTILRNDVLPEVAKNVGYLKSKNMRVLGASGQEINPSSIEWSEYVGANRKSFPYTIRQDPGPSNALGLAKFMFPNSFSVYIHDTPTKDLFQREDRAFSSGCIRIQKPMDFAAFLLRDRKDWGPEQIKKVIDNKQERTIMLTQAVPVHILYLTAWGSKDGTVHFRKDVYERDARILSGLKEKAPNS